MVQSLISILMVLVTNTKSNVRIESQNLWIHDIVLFFYPTEKIKKKKTKKNQSIKEYEINEHVFSIDLYYFKAAECEFEVILIKNYCFLHKRYKIGGPIVPYKISVRMPMHWSLKS